MRLICISDTHNRHRDVRMPRPEPGDVLVVAGDISGQGHSGEITKFNRWMSHLAYDNKIVIAGNHDFLFERDPSRAQALLTGCVYLQDSGAIISCKGALPLRIYGSPWQPRFFDWAFNLDRQSEKLRAVWQQVPTGVDVLVTHGPPFGILDPDPYGAPVGCELLREELKRIRPKLHVFGHLHSGYGMVERSGTTYVNAAMCDEAYEVHRDPVVIEW